MATLSQTAVPVARRTTFEKACELAAAGFAVFPLHADKTPAIAGGHKAATREPTAQMFAGAALVGLPTGDVNGFMVIDIDPRHGGEIWLEQNATRLPVTHTQVTRNNGIHLRFKHIPGLRNSAGKLAPGVDIRAEGGYIVAWQCEGFETRHPDIVADLEPWIVADLLAANETAAAQGIADLAPPSIEAVVKLFDILPNPPELGRDPWIAIMLAAVGTIQGAEAVGLPDAEEAIKEAALAWSARWIGADPEADREKWEADWSTRGKALAGWSQLLRHATNLGVDTLPITTPAAQRAFAAATAPGDADQPEPPNGWRGMLSTNKAGAPMAWLRNAIVALRHAPEWRGVPAFNDFSKRVMFMKPPPWEAGDFKPRAVTDVDFVDAADWLQGRGIGVSPTVAGDALVAVANRNRFHPVREYLDKLVWDRTPRIDTWLMDHLGAADTPLNRAFGSKFLISAVARIREPGCKVDTILVAEGAQGIGKSTAARTLAGPEWFADTVPEIGSKDALVQLQGRWLIEHSEMDRLRGAEATRTKAFLSSQVDTFRPPYGKVAEDFERQCVFLATVNPGGSGYLRDETGARRFWPILCGATWPPGRRIDAGALRAARDSLWAEAQHRFRAGEPWWLDTPALEAAQAEATDERFEADPWTNAVEQAAGAMDVVTLAAIMDAPQLAIPAREQDTKAARRVAAILAQLGFTRTRRRVDGKLAYVFVPPDRPGRAPDGNVVALAAGKAHRASLTALLQR